jgi:hypothetical protein
MGDACVKPIAAMAFCKVFLRGKVENSIEVMKVPFYEQ